jgi:hypothetical protein
MVSRVITDKPVPSNESKPEVVQSVIEGNDKPAFTGELAVKPGVVIVEAKRPDGTPFKIKFKTN